MSRKNPVLFPLRAALSGLPGSWGGGVELAEVLGRDETARRLERALGVLAHG